MVSTLYWNCTPRFDISKSTVIFLHAAWMSSTMFTETIDHLSAQVSSVNFLTLDLSGHGQTSMSRKKSTLWEQGEDVVALINELKIERAILVGVSMGATIAYRVALSHPSRIQALISIASTGEASSPDAIAAVIKVRDIWVSTPSPSEEIMDISIRGWGGNPDVNGPRAMTVKQHWVKRHSGAENVDSILDSLCHRESLLHRFHEITMPVILIHGEKDETWRLEGMLRIRDALINAKVEVFVVKDSGHLVIHMRESEDVSEAMSKFIIQVLQQN